MIDLSTLEALIELAQRAPKSRTERLWLEALIERINALVKRLPTEEKAMSDNQGCET
jgi:hypothetical protein